MGRVAFTTPCQVPVDIRPLLVEHAAVTVAPLIPGVHADIERLAMVTRNLLDNALKFSRDIPHPWLSTAGATMIPVST